MDLKQSAEILEHIIGEVSQSENIQIEWPEGLQIELQKKGGPSLCVYWHGTTLF